MSKSRSLQEALTETSIAGRAEPLPNDVIKLAGRALQILELFDVLPDSVDAFEAINIARIEGTVENLTSILHAKNEVRVGLGTSMIGVVELDLDVRDHVA